MPYACPKCKDKTRLLVSVEAVAELIQGDFGETLRVVSDCGFDGDSPMQCDACDHSAPAIDFWTPDDDTTSETA